MSKQLDLFAWKPAMKVVPFPADRCRGEIRLAAKALEQKHGAEASRYWTALIRVMADPLIAAGIPSDEVRRQMFAFQKAVQAELWAMADEQSAHA